jgi:malic enzyme
MEGKAVLFKKFAGVVEAFLYSLALPHTDQLARR